MARPVTDRIVAGRYVLKAPLGRGGMGVVWRAQDAVLGREVAVKEVVLPPTLAEAERRPAQARVLREARAAARLNHPGAVTLYDVVQDRGNTFIVMELVEAPTLAELVAEQGPLAVGRVAELGVQLAGALEAAHGAGIVHRDVKPGNVMVAERGGAKLADFGVASLAGDPQLTSTGLVLGSPAYMAPEQARGEASGPAADFWAMGATMFYAVEGVAPFDRGSSIATLAAVVNDPPRGPRRAGPLTDVIIALLAKDPAARPTGPALRAELARLVTRPATPTEVLPAHGPGRTIPLPVPAPGAAEGVAAASARRTEERPAPEGWAAPGAGDHGSPGALEGTDPAPAPASVPPPPRTATDRPLLPPAPVVDRRGRGRLFGVVGLLVVLALAGVLLAVNLRAGGDDNPTAAPTTRAAGAGADGVTSTTGAPRTTGAPSTTGSPATTGAPATTAAGGLPAGWTRFVNRRGANQVGVPPGFKARTRQSYNATVVEEQSGAKRVFTVRSQNPSAPLPQASRDYRTWARRTFSGFREVRYDENQTYAGHGGAVVFEYEADREGRRVHVSHINFKGRTWGYNVEFIAPAGEWDASQELTRQFERAFRAVG